MVKLHFEDNKYTIIFNEYIIECIDFVRDNNTIKITSDEFYIEIEIFKHKTLNKIYHNNNSYIFYEDLIII